MKILIYGASGKTGHELVTQALAQGHLVTAFVRKKSNLKTVHHNLKVLQGDVINYHLVEQSVKGHDTIISVLGADSPFKYDKDVVDGVSNIVKAMEQSEVSRFIYMSAINVSESRTRAGLLIRLLAPILLRTETAGHEAREDIIRKSKLDWIIVRSAGLTNGAHKKIYRNGENVKAKGIVASISRADVADFMLRQLSDNIFLRKVPVVMY